MDMYANFQKTITRQVWKQVNTSKKNTICSEPDCYSNCHLSCKMPFSFERYRMKLCSVFGYGTSTLCKVCSHHFQSHNHLRAGWSLESEDGTDIDPDARMRFESAHSEQERKEVLRAEASREIEAMKVTMIEGMNLLRELIGSYAGLSLSGNFSAQIEKAVSLFSMTRKTLLMNGGSGKTIELLDENISMLQQKIAVIRAAADHDHAYSPDVDILSISTASVYSTSD